MGEIMRTCLNIGAGENIQKSDEQTRWTNLDKCFEPGIDIVRNIEKQCLPFADSTIDHILCGDVLEHLDNLIYPMNEMWRVLKPAGVLEIGTPYGIEENWKHITHKRIFYPQSWIYFDGQDSLVQHMRKAEGIIADFHIKTSVVSEDGLNLQTSLVARKEAPVRTICTSSEVAIPNNQDGAVKLDVGCGFKKRNDTPGWIGIDQDPNSEADISCDIEKGLPFPDSSVDFIYTSHVLEHINDLMYVMDEFWRVLKKDGLVEIEVPHYQGGNALRHPDHKRLMHGELWFFWDPKVNQADRNSYGVKARFVIAQNVDHTKTLCVVEDGGMYVTLHKEESE